MAEQEKAKAVQQLLTAAREADLKVTPELRANIDKLAKAYGEASAKLELFRKVRSFQDDNDALQREVALTGLYGEALTKARIEAELLRRGQDGACGIR